MRDFNKAIELLRNDFQEFLNAVRVLEDYPEECEPFPMEEVIHCESFFDCDPQIVQDAKADDFDETKDLAYYDREGVLRSMDWEDHDKWVRSLYDEEEAVYKIAEGLKSGQGLIKLSNADSIDFARRWLGEEFCSLLEDEDK